MTPALLTNEYKHEVAKFFRANPGAHRGADAASGPRAVRLVQGLPKLCGEGSRQMAGDLNNPILGLRS